MKRFKQITGWLLPPFAWALAMIILVVGRWYTQLYNVGFRELLYTLLSPLKGTGNDLIPRMIHDCLTTVLRLTLPFLAVWLLLSRCRLTRPIWRKAGTLRTWLKRLCALVSAAALIVSLVDAEHRLGISEYIRQVSHPTTLYEEHFVAAKDISVTPPEKKKNLICLYLESFESAYASREEGGIHDVNYMPGLTALAKDNVSFSGTDKLGGFHSPVGTNWTMAALLASTSGIPFAFPVDGNAMNMYQHFAPNLTTLGDILQRDGYVQEFLCGSDGNFAGRKNYFQQHGGYEVFDLFTAREKGYIPNDYYVWWGFEDARLYQIARDELTRLAAGSEPFNFTFLTVDPHYLDGYLCQECGDTYDTLTGNVIDCADRQAAAFIDWCRQQPFYEDTVIVIMGDHPRMDVSLVGTEPSHLRPVYNCFINAPAPARGENGRLCTTMDLFPTMLSALGYSIEGHRLGLGTDLFSPLSTLAEDMGLDALQVELERYSVYYSENFT